MPELPLAELATQGSEVCCAPASSRDQMKPYTRPYYCPNMAFAPSNEALLAPHFKLGWMACAGVVLRLKEELVVIQLGSLLLGSRLRAVGLGKQACGKNGNRKD